VLTSHVGFAGLSTPTSVLVKVTFHETVASASTVTAVLVVGPTVAGEVALLSVNSPVPAGSVTVGHNFVPDVAPQLLPEYSSNFTVPLRAVPPADVTVALSFGSQIW
jgi:hypothetical protein